MSSRRTAWGATQSRAGRRSSLSRGQKRYPLLTATHYLSVTFNDRSNTKVHDSFNVNLTSGTIQEN